MLKANRDFLNHSNDDQKSFWFLQNAMQQVLESISEKRIYIILDVADERIVIQRELFELINDGQGHSSNGPRWLISSRNETQIKEILLQYDESTRTSLELYSDEVDRAVARFIHQRVSLLAKKKCYGEDVIQEVLHHMNEHAQGTFLWASLVYQELDKTTLRRTQKVLKSLPRELGELYKVILSGVGYSSDDVDEREENRDLCHVILRFVVVSLSPPSLVEIAHFADLPDDCKQNLEFTSDLVDRCGSFLVQKGKRVYLVHQSSADFFRDGQGNKIFDAGIPYEHHEVVHISLNVMSTLLKRNICNEKRVTAKVEEVQKSTIDRCLPHHLRYACQYWIPHLLRVVVLQSHPVTNSCYNTFCTG